jgi:diguanylate cyclase (GGDEF)-like protein/PAS domain S-box-containing protein
LLLFQINARFISVVKKRGGGKKMQIPGSLISLFALLSAGSFASNIASLRRLDLLGRIARTEKNKYESFFEDNPLPIWVYDNQSLRFVAVNRAATSTYGWSKAEMLALTLRDVRPPESQAHLEMNLRMRDKVFIPHVGVAVHCTRANEKKSMDVHLLQVDFDGRPATMCVMVDVTQEVTAKEEVNHSKRMLEYVLDHVPQGIAWKDLQLNYAGANKIYARDVGLSSRTELVGRSDADLRWSDEVETIRQEDELVLTGQLVKQNVERQVRFADGDETWICESKLPLRDAHGGVFGLLITYEKVTARRAAELALRLQGRALDASLNGIMILERRGSGRGRHVVFSMNYAFQRITGYPKEDVTGIGSDKVFSMLADAERWQEIHHALDNDIQASLTLDCRRKDLKPFWANILVGPVRNDAGIVTHHVCVINDVTELVQYQQRLEYQARYDSLTDLPNRSLLDERLRESIARATESDSLVFVLFLDLDRFKEVNDSLGHRVGDGILRQMGRRLRSVVRSTDLVARYGGDEFIIVIERSAGEDASPVLKRLTESMKLPLYEAGHEFYVEVSIGVSSFPGDGADADTLIRNADAAMYLAKEHGRNGFEFYRPELNSAVAEKLLLSTRLRRALHENRLQVAYQPQVDMRSGHIIGAEALLRWHESDLGSLSPSMFVPLAEQSGIIEQIGEFVLRTVCEQARTWTEMGCRPIKLSVNVSPVQLERSDMLGVVRAALSAGNLRPEYLELEVTEGALLQNTDKTEHVVRGIRELGVKLAIDDFGTGYSSLSYLNRFPVDRIKIDRSFINSIESKSGSAALTRAVIAMAHALHCDVIAEGVETEEQRRFLVEHGCLQGQGFLYWPALHPEEFQALLMSDNKP